MIKVIKNNKYESYEKVKYKVLKQLQKSSHSVAVCLPPSPVPAVPGPDLGAGEPAGRDLRAAGAGGGRGRGLQRPGVLRLHAQGLHRARLQHPP